ncbi:hypothetical protein P154DRAFT_594915 [Amniculicola lignicola CBS 123094]|uniref:Aminoglycoside phosphotransferase domain-containing protein n=1 Tax=Amniculicola lignicola CBS 123094 TaxID=1392246 RepID=A0A6A5WMP2_9PLEO|nr:hypothetical protein P154DRAFT_594915 [Amniculicola lignicola CBS 123094]
MSVELPSAKEVCQAHFGETTNSKCLQVIEDRMDHNLSILRVTEGVCDTSLFPYEAQGPFETPIPSLAEILEAGKGFSHVWRVGPYMVKVGYTPHIYQEAENMIYLERHSNIRTPKVFAAFTGEIPPTTPSIDTENEFCYFLVTEFIEGATLSRLIREDIGSPLNEKIGHMLGEQYRRLRSVPPEDPNHFGRVNGRPYFGSRVIDIAPVASDYLQGPFTYEQVVSKILDAAKANQALSVTPDDYTTATKLLYRSAEYTLLKAAGPNDRIPTLSHMDFNHLNIMVKVARNEEGKVVDVEEVILIDWEWLAWMPSWFEAGGVYVETIGLGEPHEGFARRVLEAMGQVNMGIVAFFAYGLYCYAFFRF